LADWAWRVATRRRREARRIRFEIGKGDLAPLDSPPFAKSAKDGVPQF
jgi:hypothetical protein